VDHNREVFDFGEVRLRCQSPAEWSTQTRGRPPGGPGPDDVGVPSRCRSRDAWSHTRSLLSPTTSGTCRNY